MHLRLILLALLVKRFMLLDTSLPPDGSEPTREEMMREEIVPLYARALTHMYDVGWTESNSTCYTLMVGKRSYKRRWFGRTLYEPVIMRARGIAGMGHYLMMNGAVYRSDPSRRTNEEYRDQPAHQLITDLTTLDMVELPQVFAFFHAILRIEPAHAFIDN
jgi:hypothetical protein